MPKGRDIGAALKKRAEESAAAAAQSEQFANEVYGVIIGGKTESSPAKVQRECRAVPASKLRNFFTAQIGFRPYSQPDLKALADDIEENGLLEYGIVRPIHGTDEYEVLSGRNRRDACMLLGWDVIPYYIEDCNDARAIVIATVTNLKRRQNLLHSERGWAYRALLEAQRCQGKRVDLGEETSVEFQQKLTTRDRVAKVFGIKAHEVQRDIRLTYLIPPLLDAVDEKRLKVGVGTVLAGYDETSQQVFFDRWQGKEVVPPKLMKYLKAAGQDHPASHFSPVELDSIWKQAENDIAQLKTEKFSFSFDGEQYAPIISKLGGEKEVRRLFLNFLDSQVQEGK